MKLYLKTIISLLSLFTQSISKSVNSGCFSGNKKIDVFCEYTGCSLQPHYGQYDEPIIIKNIKQNKQEQINFVCSSQTQSNNENIINYNIVASNQDNEFFIPISISNKNQYWFSPVITPVFGTLNISFNNLEALETKDSIVIVRQDLSVYCEIYISDLTNDQTYSVLSESNMQNYMIRVGLYNNHKNDYARCPTPENPKCENCHKIYIQNHTMVNAPYHLRQSPRHILIADNYVNIRTAPSLV